MTIRRCSRFATRSFSSCFVPSCFVAAMLVLVAASASAVGTDAGALSGPTAR